MSSSASRRAPGGRVLSGDVARTLPTAPPVAAPGGTLRLFGAPEEVEEETDALEAARAEAFAEGVAQASADATAEAARRQAEATERAADALVAALAATAEARAALVAEATGDALTLCYELLGVVLGDEAVRKAVPAADTIQRVLALAPAGEDLLVRVPPGFPLDIAEIAPSVDPARVRVVEDRGVELGGCIVEAGACRIDGQIASALARVRAILDSSGAAVEETA